MNPEDSSPGCPPEIRSRILGILRAPANPIKAEVPGKPLTDPRRYLAVRRIPPSSTVASQTSSTVASEAADRPTDLSTVASAPTTKSNQLYGGLGDAASTVALAPELYGGLSPDRVDEPSEATVDIPPVGVTVVGTSTSTVAPIAMSTVASSSDDNEDDDVDDEDLVASEDSFVGRFQRLTHVNLARLQSRFAGGSYRAPLQVVTTALLQAHFAGDVTLGFAVLEDGTGQGDALFGGIDVDERFPQRLPVIADALRALGSEALARAVLVTTGSTEGRGKIVLTFERPAPSSLVRAVVQAVYRRALRDPRFGHMTRPDEVEVRPLGGTGGLLRILGRNAAKDRPGALTPCDTPLTIDGELTDLSNIQPLPLPELRRIAESYQAQQADPNAWIDAMLAEAWTYRPEEGNTRGVFRRVIALARAALERHGPERGEERFRAWCAAVAARSPALDEPSPTNRDRRNPVRHEPSLRRAWRYALTRTTTFEPLDVRGSGLPAGQVRVYEALVAFVRARGLSPICFAMNYRYLQEELLGGTSDKKTVWKQTNGLVQRGMLVIHDRGLAMGRYEDGEGRRGLPTILGLVGRGQTPADVLATVRSDPKLFARLANRTRDRAALLEPTRRRRSKTA
jgi:hypothetical protein